MDQLFAKNCAEESTENRNLGFERSCHSKDRRPRARRNESRRVGFSIRAAAAGCVAHDSPGKRTHLGGAAFPRERFAAHSALGNQGGGSRTNGAPGKIHCSPDPGWTELYPAAHHLEEPELERKRRRSGGIVQDATANSR